MYKLLISAVAVLTIALISLSSMTILFSGERPPEFFSEYQHLLPGNSKPDDCINDLPYDSYDLAEFSCHYRIEGVVVFLYGKQYVITSTSVLFPEGTRLGDILSGLNVTNIEFVGGQWWRWEFDGGYIYTGKRNLYEIARVATILR